MPVCNDRPIKESPQAMNMPRNLGTKTWGQTTGLGTVAKAFLELSRVSFAVGTGKNRKTMV